MSPTTGASRQRRRCQPIPAACRGPGWAITVADQQRRRAELDELSSCVEAHAAHQPGFGRRVGQAVNRCPRTICHPLGCLETAGGSCQMSAVDTDAHDFEGQAERLLQQAARDLATMVAWAHLVERPRHAPGAGRKIGGRIHVLSSVCSPKRGRGSVIQVGLRGRANSEVCHRSAGARAVVCCNQ